MLGLHGALSLLGGMRGKPRRGMLRRAVFSDFQRKGLEKVFQKQKYISKPDRKKLAEKLGLKDSQVCIKISVDAQIFVVHPYKLSGGRVLVLR
jgi:Homeodomain